MTQEFDFDAAVAATLQPAAPSPQSARLGFVTAMDTNPDAQAEARRVARSTGVPVDTALNLPADVKKQARLGEIDFDALAQTSPATAALLADVERAKVAHDDVESLSLIERTVRQFAGGAVEVVGNKVAGYGGLLDIAQRNVAGAIGSLLPTPRAGGEATTESLAGPLIGEGWREGGGLVKKFARNGVMVPAARRTFYDDVTGGLGQLAGQIATWPIDRGMGLYAQGADIMAEKVAPDIASQGMKDLAVLGGAAVTGVTEKYALDKILGPMAVPIKNRMAAALARLGIAGATEGGQEMLESIGQDALRQVLTNPDADIRFGDALYEGGVGATVGAIARSVVEAALHVRSRGVQREQVVQQAEQDGRLIAALDEAAPAAKLRERDADMLQKLVADATEEGSDSFYIDADVLMQSGVAEQLAQSSPAVAEQLRTAFETGGMVRIPIDEFTARVAGTDISQPLLDHLRADPSRPTPAEARAFRESGAEEAMRAEFDRVFAEQDADAALRQSASAVHDKVRAELDTAARFTPEVNDAYAGMVGNFYAVTAGKLGLTPEQLFEKYPLRVQAEAVAGGERFEQGASGTLDDVRQAWGDAGIASSISERGDVITLSKIIVPDAERGSGKGTAAMQRLVEYADAAGKHIALTPASDFGGNKKRLTAFYKRFGFVENKGRNRAFTTSEAMYRQAPGKVLEQGARATYSPSANLVTLLKGADLTSFLHESGHAFLEMQTQIAAEIARDAALYGPDRLTEGERRLLADTDALLAWFGVADLDTWQVMSFEERRAHHEQFARGFEKYLFEGRAPAIELQGLFQRFRAWLLNVYRSLAALNVELTDEVRGVMDRMLATDEQIRLAEQARSMMPLFESAEEAGMTPDEFAAYQALGQDATAEAQADLAARGVRDMQWLRNARGRELKRLQKEAASRRAEMQIEARREVMSQPVYRAWQFLTAKLTQDDKVTPTARPKSDPNVVDETLDSLFVAIAKLGGIQREQLEAEWGLDAKEKVTPPLFGKHVLRRTDGLSIDDMRTALVQYGYLSGDESAESWNPREFEEAFMAELGGSPVYSSNADYTQLQDARPGDGLNLDGLAAGRLDRAGLAEIGIPDEIVEHVTNLKMTAKDGIHPDLVAELFGFSSGDELVRTLAAAQTPKEEINTLTDQRMLERHGELATPAAIERAADRAIHNEARARFVTTELNTLAQATGSRKILASAAREYAARMIARQKVRHIRPGQYGAAEARAAKAAQDASRSGDVAQAAAEKRNQLVNLHATKAAHDALDEVEKGVRYLRRFESAGSRKGLDAEYLEQIDDLLERYDLRRGQSLKAIDKRQSFAEWAAQQSEMGLDPTFDAALLDAAQRQHYKNLTLEEFRGIVDAAKNIEHLGRLKKKLLTAKDAREFAAIVAEAEESIRANGGEARPLEIEEPTRFKAWLEGALAGHRKFSSLLRQMDGGRDGGPLWRILGRSMNEAATVEAVMIEQATEKLAALYAPILALKGGTHGGTQFIPEINASLTRGARLAVALNWGNATNRQRVMGGDNWNEAQVNAILARLTRAEWQFVQGAWDYVDSFWPEIAAKEKRVSGVVPEKVEASPFAVTLADGTTMELAGGYYPIKYDANRDDRAEKHDAAAIADDMKRGAFTRSTTRRGHTKARTDEVRRPVRKSLDVITQHVAQVAHDLAWHEWLIDANRLIDARPINSAIREHYGTAALRTMKDMLTAIATADVVPQTKMDEALLYLRANVSRSTMGMSLTTAFLQPFGLTQSIARIGAKHVLRGLARWGGDAARFESSLSWIRGKSDFMRLRGKTFNRELHEIKGRVSHGHSKARQIYDASLFMLMQKMQTVADVPTWIGQYEKGVAEGLDDETAVALADQAVLDSQGGGQTKDMAEFQRKHPMLTMFYSYFNVTYNLAAESTARTDFKNPLAVAGWIADMLLLMVIPALGPALILELLRGGGDDEPEEWAKKLAAWQAGYLFGTVVGVRELSGLVSGYDYAGPPVGRVIADLGSLGKQVAQGELDENLALSSIRLMGTATGVPTVQLIRSWRGWRAWEEDDAPAAAILLGPPPKE